MFLGDLLRLEAAAAALIGIKYTPTALSQKYLTNLNIHLVLVLVGDYNSTFAEDHSFKIQSGRIW
jgi:hypothetical protein